jgi:hypothetical protein
VFQVHRVDETGQPALRRKLRRAEVLRHSTILSRHWLASRLATRRIIGRVRSRRSGARFGLCRHSS